MTDHSFALSLILVLSLMLPGSAFAEQEVSLTASTAVTSIGVTRLQGGNREGGQDLGTLAMAASIATKLSEQTYFKATAIDASPAFVSGPQDFLKIINQASVDALLVAEVQGRQLRWKLIGSRGQTLTASQTILKDQSTDWPSAISEDLAPRVPFRGVIVKSFDPKHFQINLGSNVGLVVGQRLSVFDFRGPDFNSEKQEIGFARVISVKPNSAIIVPVSSAVRLREQQKIAFDDQSRGMSSPDSLSSDVMMSFGGGLLAIGTDVPSSKYDNLVYRVNSSPILALGLKYHLYQFRGFLSQAKSDTSELLYSDISATREFWQSALGLWRLRFQSGVRWAHYAYSLKVAGAVGPASSDVVSPVFSLDTSYVLAGPFSVLADIDVYAPLIVSGVDTSALIFSFGGAILVGARLDLSSRWVFDAGAQFKNFRRPIDGQTTVQEKHTLFFTDLIYKF